MTALVGIPLALGVVALVTALGGIIIRVVDQVQP